MSIFIILKKKINVKELFSHKYTKNTEKRLIQWGRSNGIEVLAWHSSIPQGRQKTQRKIF